MHPHPKSKEVSLGRASINEPLASQLHSYKPRLRSRIIANILNEKAGGLDLTQLVAAMDDLNRLGAILNQSIRFTRGQGVNIKAIKEIVQLIQTMRHDQA